VKARVAPAKVRRARKFGKVEVFVSICDKSFLTGDSPCGTKRSSCHTIRKIKRFDFFSRTKELLFF
jgi:hypothetical protein